MSYHYSSLSKSLEVEGIVFYRDRNSAITKCLVGFENIKDKRAKRRYKKQLPYSSVVQVIMADGGYVNFHAVKFALFQPDPIKIKPEKRGRQGIDAYWIRLSETDFGAWEGGMAAGRDIINYDQLEKDAIADNVITLAARKTA